MTDQNNPAEQGSGEAPSIPEKFQDADGNLDSAKLLNSYNELQSQFTQNRQAPKAKGSPQIPESRSDGPLTFDAFEAEFKEFAENGELSDETWQSLESRTGVSRQVIEDYATSRGLAQQLETQRAFAPYGGEEAVNEALQWAGKNMDSAEVTRLNAALEAGGEGGALALEKIMNGFNAATGGADVVQPRGGHRDPGVSGFTNKAEFQAALREADRTGDHTELDRRLNATKDKSVLM